MVRKSKGAPPMKRLPWNVGEYVRLEPNDLLPHPAPTPEQRIRVAACVATILRDEAMLGVRSSSSANHETIRALLTMSPEAWARDIIGLGDLRHPVLGSVLAYDHIDPKTRFDQTVNSKKN